MDDSVCALETQGLRHSGVTLQENPHCVTASKWHYQSSPLSCICKRCHNDKLPLRVTCGLWLKKIILLKDKLGIKNTKYIMVAWTKSVNLIYRPPSPWVNLNQSLYFTWVQQCLCLLLAFLPWGVQSHQAWSKSVNVDTPDSPAADPPSCLQADD